MGTKRNLTAIAADLKGAEIDLGANDANCGCGCGEVTNKDRRFLQGHDRRFIANMVNAELVNAKIELFDNTGSKGEFTGKELAEKLLTDRGQLMFNHHLASAENPAKRPSRAKAAKAEDAQDEIVSEIEGSWVQVKIGRWTYDAQVIDSEDQVPTEVRYTKKDKTEVFTTKFTLV